jgi:hypothetical protein
MSMTLDLWLFVESCVDGLEELMQTRNATRIRHLLRRPSLAANQYGDNNRQYNQFGEGAQRIVDGRYFEAHGNQSFGMVPPKES